MALNDLTCKNAKAAPRTYKLYDGGGLYLEVSPKGQRYWRLKFQIYGKEKRLSFGVYPVVSLLDARAKRDDAKRTLQQGIDPSLAKKEAKRLAKFNAEQTFEVVAMEWFNHYLNRWTPRHSDNILYRLKKDVFPQIGNYPVKAISAPILYECIQKIDKRGKHEMARRALQMCSQVMRYAVITGRAERDPSPELRGSLMRHNKQHFASIDIDDLPILLKKINQNDNRLFRQTILAFKLMLLTFVRTNELIQADWSEIDLKAKSWNIPAERMKMRMPHFVPLSNQAVEILKELKGPGEKTGYVFPSISKAGKPMSNGTILMALDRMGYRGKMTGHGFRALAMGAIKEKLRYPHEVVDRQLAHQPIKAVDKAYDRAKFIPDRVKMMQDWANYIDTLT